MLGVWSDSCVSGAVKRVEHLGVLIVTETALSTHGSHPEWRSRVSDVLHPPAVWNLRAAF